MQILCGSTYTYTHKREFFFQLDNRVSVVFLPFYYIYLSGEGAIPAFRR